MINWWRRFINALLYWPVRIFVKAHTIPANVTDELGIDPAKPIIYVLHTDSIADALALAFSCKKIGLPSPLRPIALPGTEQKYRRVLFLRGTSPIFSKQPSKTNIEKHITELFHYHRQVSGVDIQFVPVYITWGRAPDKSKPGFSDVLVDVASPSWLRKLFIVLFLGRDNFVSYSRAVSSQFLAKKHGSDELIAKKLIRVAATHFQRKRQGLTGPTLMERQTLHSAVIGSPSVKLAMRDEVRAKNITPAKAKQTAHGYLDEIAGDYREGLVRFADRILTPLWNKIYRGITVHNAQVVRELSRNGHEIVYVPCHRSHMDYLLLTYVIYHEGIVTPHIAAGINLNFWPAGPIFRRAGAFFLRRSFAGNKLYTAVFREYLELLFNKGYSVKYYPEGGRSRTGRLLPPKTGMLAMTIQAMSKGINRPVSIVPVYIGYEHVMEVSSYVKELRGKKKKKESPLQVLSAVKKLRNYGHGNLSFGQPIQLNKFLDSHTPEWVEESQLPDTERDRKPKWLSTAVNKLAHDVMFEINRSAAINGMALVSTCLLSAKRNKLSEKELLSAIEDFIQLHQACPFSTNVCLPDKDVHTIYRETLALKRLTVTEDSFGKMISPMPDNAVALTYYRNNIIHLFALPGLIMSLIFDKVATDVQSIKDKVAILFPIMRKELFIYYDMDEALQRCELLIQQFIDQGLILQGTTLTPPSASATHFNSAWLLSRIMQEAYQRYAVVLHILANHKSVSRNTLEKDTRQIAERLSELYGVSSPEFSDKNVIATIIIGLRENGYIESNEQGSLSLSKNDKTAGLSDMVKGLVWPEIIQHLEMLD